MDNHSDLRIYLNNQRGHNKLIEEIDQKQYHVRDMKKILEQYINNFLTKNQKERRWIVIPGLRGVGKTTLMAQTYNWVYQKYVKNQPDLKKIHMIYFSLDTVKKLNGDLHQALKTYESLLRNRLENVSQPILLFIDEIQKDPDWSQILKTVYDQSSNIFIICTGSSATYLQMDADTAGRRASIQRLYPLSFNEYQMIVHNKPLDNDLRQELNKVCYWSNSADEVYQKLNKLHMKIDDIWSEYDHHQIEHYLTVGSLPFAPHCSDNDIYQALMSNIEKIVYEDLITDRRFNFNKDSIDKIMILIFILASSNGTPTLSTLSDVLKINRQNLSEILRALIKAEVLIRIPAYGNFKSTINLPARYQFMGSAIRCAHWNVSGRSATSEIRRGQLMEDVVSLHYYREFMRKSSGELTYVYDRKNTGHCDFILKLIDSHQIALEFGLGQKNFKQVETTMKKINCDYGLVFSNSPLRLNKDKNAVMIPLDFFFLM